MHFDETFWVAISTVLFVFFVYKPIARFLAKSLDTRSAKIKEELDDAVCLREEAQALLASYQRKNRNADEEAEEIIEHAKKEAERIAIHSKRALEDELSKRTELALQKIAQAEASVIQEIRDNAVDITVSAARTLIIENLGNDAAEEIINTAVSDIGRKLH